jgi:hypothetical protein
VRRDHHVVESKKLLKLRRHARLALQHVQTRPCNALRSESIDQRVGIDDRPAPDIDDIALSDPAP